MGTTRGVGLVNGNKNGQLISAARFAFVWFTFCNLFCGSDFRTVERQKSIFRKKTKQKARNPSFVNLLPFFFSFVKLPLYPFPLFLESQSKSTNPHLLYLSSFPFLK